MRRVGVADQRGRRRGSRNAAKILEAKPMPFDRSPHWNDYRAAPAVLYTGLASNHERVGYSRVDKDGSERGLETIQIVRDK